MTTAPPSADDHRDPQDLSLFQQNILLVLATKEDTADYGLGIKQDLEDVYGEDVTHGRLYANLDELIELGLVEKSAIDRRTNSYGLTDAGKALLRRDAQRRLTVVDGLNGGHDA